MATCTICKKDCEADHFDTPMHKRRFAKALEVMFKNQLVPYYKDYDEKVRVKHVVALTALQIIHKIRCEKLGQDRNLVMCSTCCDLIVYNKARPQCLVCWQNDKKGPRKVYKTSQTMRRASKTYYHKTGCWTRAIPK